MIDMQSEVILEVKDLSKLFLDPSESLALGWQNPLSGQLVGKSLPKDAKLSPEGVLVIEMFSLL